MAKGDIRKFLVVCALGGLVVAGCNKKETNTQSVEQKIVEVAPKPNWEKGQNTDKMTGETENWAITTSTNTVSMKFPHNGGSVGSIIVFDNRDVKIHISKGQVMCTSYSGCKINVKFDDGKVETYSAVGQKNGGYDAIFLERGQYSDGSATRFIKKLSSAKKVMVSLEVYQEYNTVWEFNVEGYAK